MTTPLATSGVSAATTLPASTVHSEISESSGAPLTLEALAGVVDRMGANIDVLSRNMAAMQAALASLLPPPPPASQLPPPLTAAITDLARSVAAIQSYLGISANGFPLRDARLRHDAAAVSGRAANGPANIAAD
jgi:hypothetical protein